MTTLLQIDASSRITRSISRSMTNKFTEQWLNIRSGDKVIKRDVGKNPPPAIGEAWIDAAFTAVEKRTRQQETALKISDELLAELEVADLIVMGAPMYNYGMPSALKAWIDQIIRINRTFSFDLARGDRPIEPLLTGKILVILCSSGEGGFEPGGVRATMNHLDPHIVTVSSLFGVSKHYVVRVEYQEFNDERHQKSLALANRAISKLVQQLTQQIEDRADETAINTSKEN